MPVRASQDLDLREDFGQIVLTGFAALQTNNK